MYDSPKAIHFRLIDSSTGKNAGTNRPDCPFLAQRWCIANDVANVLGIINMLHLDRNEKVKLREYIRSFNKDGAKYQLHLADPSKIGFDFFDFFLSIPSPFLSYSNEVIHSLADNLNGVAPDICHISGDQKNIILKCLESSNEKLRLANYPGSLCLVDSKILG